MEFENLNSLVDYLMDGKEFDIYYEDRYGHKYYMHGEALFKEDTLWRWHIKWQPLDEDWKVKDPNRFSSISYKSNNAKPLLLYSLDRFKEMTLCCGNEKFELRKMTW